MPVVGVDQMGGEADEHQDRADFQQHHDVVGARRLANAAHQHERQQHHHYEGRDIEAEMPARVVQRIALQVGEPARQISRRDPAQVRQNAEPVQQTYKMGGKPHADRHIADRVLQDQVPADDPGHQFTHGGVGIGIGAPGDGDHRGQLGVTQGGEGAGHRHQDEGQGDGRAGAGPAERSRMVDQVFQQRRIEHRGELQLDAGDGCSDHGEDAGADDGADTQGSQADPAQRLLQAALGTLRIGNQPVDILDAEQL